MGERGGEIRAGWLQLLQGPDVPARARSAAAADFGRLLYSVGASGRR